MDCGERYPLKDVIRLLRQYAWLAEFRIVDFITSDSWNTTQSIPECWRQFVEALPEDDYASALMEIASPSSDQEPDSAIKEFAVECYKCSFVTQNLPEQLKKCNNPPKHEKVKQKKAYEITILSEEISKIMFEHNLLYAVDVGAGQGYLAVELLKKDARFQVIGIEGSDVQVHGTAERLEKNLDSLKQRFTLRQLYLRADRTGTDFDELIFQEQGKVQDYAMYSLHACGSLSESMLEIFCDPSCRAQILFNVSCCYNLIDSNLPGIHFPMSGKVFSMWGTIELTRNMKMVACQTPFRWKHRINQIRNFFKRHFYRALLQQLLESQYGGRVDCAQAHLEKIGNISDAALKSFFTYTRAAFSNMKLGEPEESFTVSLFQKYKHLERALAFMWTMRALLGPPLEALILYDRYCFVKERLLTATVRLQPIFEPLNSPRNMALVVIKRELA